ncbi:ATP-binding protein, partial [Candidatus Saccharibacteria bacterium]|nr:ATP-binding protein [Candidatus Saccharibacteria bacterium]
MKYGTLILLCGLPGAGKSTLASKLANEIPAVVMSPDQAMYERGISFFDEQARANIEAEQWQKALELAKNGKNVVLENGFWGRDERDKLRHEAHSLGLKIVLRFLDIPFEELWQRVDARNKKENDKDAELTRQRLEQSVNQLQRPTSEEIELFDELVA